MWQEVYYNELDENYMAKGRKILPYSVKCVDSSELKEFKQFLNEKQFCCVEEIVGQQSLLVNIKLKRWCTYPKAVWMSCKNSKTYTADEFKKIIKVR